MIIEEFIQPLVAYSEAFISRAQSNDQVAPLPQLGTFCCRSKQTIRRIPFVSPCLMVVLQGQKHIGDERLLESYLPGDMFVVPACQGLDIINAPAVETARYLALCIPFQDALLQRFRQSFPELPTRPSDKGKSFLLVKHAQLFQAVLHFMQLAVQNDADSRLLEHRALEILLTIVCHHPQLKAYFSYQRNWSDRLRSILSADITRDWQLSELCHKLGASEATLRRRLREEDTGFREMLEELRMGHGLWLLQQSSMAINRVALHCGYQSASRFSERFKQKFGLSPLELRRQISG